MIATRTEPVPAGSEPPGITLSTVEAALLAGLLGGQMLLGIQDPFEGWLAEDVRAALSRARSALAERGLITMGAGGVTVEAAAAALVGTWTVPEASFLVSTTPAGGPAEVRYFHLTHLLAVEQIPAGDSTVRLTALADAGDLCRRILLTLGLGSQRAAPGAAVVVPEALLAEARQRAGEAGPEAAGQLLAGAHQVATDFLPLAESLAHPVAGGALAAMTRRLTTWEVGGVAFLEGQAGLWRLRSLARGGEPWVEALPCDGDRARLEVRRVVRRVLPEPLCGAEGVDPCGG